MNSAIKQDEPRAVMAAEGFVVLDNFLQDFHLLREYCDELDYSGEVNPVDGVEYPGISSAVPGGIQREVQFKLQALFGKLFESGTVFFRLTPEGTEIPHQAHNDATMGAIGIILYMNRGDDCQGGTATVRHTSAGMELGPVDVIQENIWKQDTNTPDKWEVIDTVEMVPNRAFIFDTRRMHRAEPPGAAFGTDAKDGRLVLVGFYW